LSNLGGSLQTDSWLFLIDPELEGFGEKKELMFDDETGIVSEKKVEKNIKQEEKNTISIDESSEKIVENENKNESIQKGNKRIEIRGLTDDDVTGLKLIARKAKAANLNQFMLDQVYLILRNSGLSIYDNRLADDILEVKDMLFKIADAQTKQELHDMQIIAKLDANINAVLTWIEFMSMAETKQF